MKFDFNAWIGQVTTGHGFMILGPTFLAVVDGTITWQTAVPLMVAGAVGLLWPENMQLAASAQAVTTDIEGLVAAYRTGIRHGAAAAAQGATDASDAAAPAIVESRAPTAAAAIALMAAGLLSLTACSGETPAQQAALGQAVASGLVCLADASGKVVVTATTSDPNAVKAINSAVAAGSVLTTDTTCQTAIANGVAAMPNKAATAP